MKYRISTGILPAIWLLMFHCRASLRPAGKVVSTRSTLSCLSRMRNSMEVGSMSVFAQENWMRLTPSFTVKQAVLADHGDVFGVVDRELRALAGGQGHEIHGGFEACSESEKQQKRHEYAAEHERFPSEELFSIVLRRRRVCQEPWNRRVDCLIWGSGQPPYSLVGDD